ncbi:MAG: hypothetical protein HY320_15945 [Armatimonadetes bacterium]|nr:hypothetical protein [Armatimonadota bacterium]
MTRSGTEEPLMLYDLPLELQRLVGDEIDPRERLLWTGQPRPGRFARQMLPVLLFGIPFFGFAVFWTSMATWGVFSSRTAGHGPPGPFLFFPLFGLPFLLVGAGMLLSPLFMAWAARRTVYAVTDQWAIIFQGGWKTAVRSFRKGDLSQIQRTQFRDGSGDLIFCAEFAPCSRGYGYYGYRGNQIGFIGVDNVKSVEDLIERHILQQE